MLGGQRRPEIGAERGEGRQMDVGGQRANLHSKWTFHAGPQGRQGGLIYNGRNR